MPVDELRHFEHADLCLAVEHRLQIGVGDDISLVLRVLEVVFLDVIPEFLRHFAFARAASGFIGFMNAGFGLRLVFAFAIS